MTRDASCKHLFVVGCQRSGTTWLQLLLGHHPAVSTANETHLFSDFLGPVLRGWTSSTQTHRDTGLRPLFSHDEFLSHLRAIARDTMSRIAEEGTRVVLEKTPQHALWAREILTVFPDAHILHLLRDPRDVAASLLAASDDWGSSWAPGNAYDAAWRWRDYIQAARAIQDLTDRFRELKYEELYADPRGRLAELFEWVELDATDDLLARAVRETRLSRLREGNAQGPWDLRDEPEGFFRKGGSGNWREDLSRSQVRLVEHVCRELMEEKGYRLSRPSRLPPLGLLPYWLRDKVRRRLC